MGSKEGESGGLGQCWFGRRVIEVWVTGFLAGVVRDEMGSRVR